MSLANNRYFLRAVYYPWIAFPYRARRVVTRAGIWGLLRVMHARGVHRRQEVTPVNKLFELSFWGTPDVDAGSYTLAIDGSVQNPLTLSLEELEALPAVERTVTLDCVGGSRNNCVMRGVAFESLLDRVAPHDDVQTAIFHCADGYSTTHPVEDLLQTDALMAYRICESEIPRHGYPLRLVAPGKYGYKWAKWVTRIELVPGAPKGHWEKRGLPDRAWVGDTR